MGGVLSTGGNVDDDIHAMPHELALFDVLQAAINAVLICPPGPTLDDLADALCSLSACTDRLAKQRAAAQGIVDSASRWASESANRARQLADAARAAHFLARSKALGKPPPDLEVLLTRLTTPANPSVLHGAP